MSPDRKDRPSFIAPVPDSPMSCERTGIRPFENLGVTEAEMKIIQALSADQLKALCALQINPKNIPGLRQDTVAVRTEDIFYFMQSLVSGSIPYGGQLLRTASNPDGLHVTPNPESPIMAEAIAAHGGQLGIQDFKQARHKTSSLYGDIGSRQALWRNVMEPLLPDGSYGELAQKMDDYMREHPIGDALGGDREDVLSWVLEQAEKAGGSPLRASPNRYPTLAWFIRQLNPAADVVKAKIILDGFAALKDRGGLLIYIGPQILNHFEVDQRSFTNRDSISEITLWPKADGDKLLTSAIIGIECLGEFEESLLEELGKLGQG